MIFTYLKETAEAYLGDEVTSAVVAVPASFNPLRRQAVRRAATLSDLQVLRIVHETSCSVLGYCLNIAHPTETRVLILDIGGGSTDVSLVSVEEGIFEVLAIAGIHHLGGEDIDRRLVAHLAHQFRQDHGKDLTDNPRALRRLRISCEQAKCMLSAAATRATIAIDSLCDGIDFFTSISRAELEDLCQDLFQSVSTLLEKVLRDAKLNKSAVGEVVLMGGSTRIPRIKTLVSNFFNGNPSPILHRFEATVVHGAAILESGILTGDTSEKTQDMFILDVVPCSLGIGTYGGVMTPLVKRNTSFPMRKSEIFSTAWDNQEDIVIEVYEGERARTKDNTFLGQILLSGILPAPRGVPQIEVTFEIDPNCCLTVSAENRETRRSCTLRLDMSSSGPHGFSDADIAQIVAREAVEVAGRTAANAQFKTYVQTLRASVRELEPALKDAESWLETQAAPVVIAPVEEYNVRQNRLEAVVRPVVEAFVAASTSGAGGRHDIPIPVADVVDEEAVKRWVKLHLPDW